MSSYAALCLLFLSCNVLNEVNCHQLEAVKVSSRLPEGRQATSAIFDGKDVIYIIGGSNRNSYNTKDILKYNVTSDTIEKVAELPRGLNDGTNSMDKDGNIYHASGEHGPIASEPHKIYKYSPSTNTVEIATSLPFSAYDSATVSDPENRDKIYILGGWPYPEAIVSFNMATQTAEWSHNLSSNYYPMTAFNDDDGYTYLFGQPALVPTVEQWVIKLNLSTNQVVATGPHNFPRLKGKASTVWDGRYAYVIGGYGDLRSGYHADTILQFDPVTMDYVLLPVTNFPANRSRFLQEVSAVYVHTLGRIYIIGGFSMADQGGAATWIYHDEIWYIELYPGQPTTTTEFPPSTTLNPDVYTCQNRSDGMYPHPYSCDKFINCNGGQLTEFRCPYPLLFDPVGLTCNMPHLVDCEITCVGREDGVYPHPQDCSLFIGCADERVHIYQCPTPLLFDPVTGRCDLPEIVQC